MSNGNGNGALPLMPLCPFRMTLPGPSIIAAADIQFDQRRCIADACMMWVVGKNPQGQTTMAGCAIPLNLIEQINTRNVISQFANFAANKLEAPNGGTGPAVPKS